MEMIGDADELEYGEEPARQRSPLASTESLAVGSLALAMCSFFAGGVFQFLGFVLVSALDNPIDQYLLISAPTAILAGAAIAMGLTATRHESLGRWVAGIAGGGVIVGAVSFVITVIGMVLALTLGNSREELF